MNWMNELMDVSDMLAWDYIGPVLIRWRQNSLWAAVALDLMNEEIGFKGFTKFIFFHIWGSILCSWYWHESLSLQSRDSTINCKRINEKFSCWFFIPVSSFLSQFFISLSSSFDSCHHSCSHSTLLQLLHTPDSAAWQQPIRDQHWLVSTNQKRVLPPGLQTSSFKWPGCLPWLRTIPAVIGRWLVNDWLWLVITCSLHHGSSMFLSKISG